MAFVAPIAAAAGTFLTSGAGMAALGLASAGLTGYSQIQEGKYRAAVAKNNAIIAEQNATEESRRSQQEQIRSDREYAALLGEQLAAQGASGFDILGRTQMATRNVTRRVGREAAMDIRDEGTGAARRLMQDAANFRSEASSAKRQGWVSGISTFAEGARGFAGDMGWTSSLATSRSRRGRRPRNSRY